MEFWRVFSFLLFEYYVKISKNIETKYNKRVMVLEAFSSRHFL